MPGTEVADYLDFWTIRSLRAAHWIDLVPALSNFDR